MPDNLTQTFQKMNFFELQEDNEMIVYCYEVEGDDCYFIASDELGNTPQEGKNIIVACYSHQDTFLWKVEVKTIEQLVNLYQENKNFIDILSKLNKEA